MNKLAILGGGVAGWMINDIIGGGTFKLVLLGAAAAAVAVVANKDEKRTAT